jgi:hypothetical protein
MTLLGPFQEDLFHVECQRVKTIERLKQDILDVLIEHTTLLAEYHKPGQMKMALLIQRVRQEL